MSRKHTQLSPAERDKIALWKAKKVGIREIARRLERSPSSIHDELKRNRFGEYYVSITAQAKAEKRKSQAGKREPLKDAVTYSYVLEKLGWGWSPEQISGRLEREKGQQVISHEAIYQFIYAEENKERKLWEKLPRKQKRRKKKYGRKSQRGHIPDRVSIHERPSEVETRKVVGHWEGDSVEGKAHKSGVHTQVERKTRITLIAKLNNLTSEETLNAQKYLFSWLPKQLKKSTTNDNGKEFYFHQQFELPVYFADPYSSFQRGTNENTNGLLRRYFPKGTDFTPITQEELNDVAQELNNKPRKCLGFATPAEEFIVELRKCSDST
jgi:IS30 family transposase